MKRNDRSTEEIRAFIEPLDGITCTLTSDHTVNLLEQISFKFHDDKGKCSRLR